MTARALIVLVGLLGLGSPASAQEGKFEPIPEQVSSFLTGLFEKVPAPTVAAGIPKTTCRKDDFANPLPGPGGAEIVGAYFCMIDFGCDKVDGAPVWIDRVGQLWFGPDSAGRLLGMYCPESISDPRRRKELEPKGG